MHYEIHNLCERARMRKRERAKKTERTWAGVYRQRTMNNQIQYTVKYLSVLFSFFSQIIYSLFVCSYWRFKFK